MVLGDAVFIRGTALKQGSCTQTLLAHPRWCQVVKNPPANTGNARDDPWVGKIPWRRKWQPTQYSCLENPMDRGAWRATVHGAAESDTTEHAHNATHSPYGPFVSM